MSKIENNQEKIKFKAFKTSLESTKDSVNFLKNCDIIFNGKSVEENSDYSIGSTYFIGSKEKPKSDIESLALSIFELHTRGLEFNKDLSGAEFWSQVIDARDNIGFHWDRDYGLEENHGVHMYPYLASGSMVKYSLC